MHAGAIHAAFRDAARESQATFRIVMDAMARPGRILPLAPSFISPPPLTPAAAAILLTLVDFETPLWLDAALSREPAVAAFLRFHTGARLAPSPETAAFALIADPASAPPLAVFAQGAPDYPDRSTTIIWQVETLQPHGWTFAGPGIREEIAFGASPLPPDFASQLQDNRARFPLGVDLIFAGPGVVAALPRSARLTEAR